MLRILEPKDRKNIKAPLSCCSSPGVLVTEVNNPFCLISVAGLSAPTAAGNPTDSCHLSCLPVHRSLSFLGSWQPVSFWGASLPLLSVYDSGKATQSLLQEWVSPRPGQFESQGLVQRWACDTTQAEEHQELLLYQVAQRRSHSLGSAKLRCSPEAAVAPSLLLSRENHAGNEANADENKGER